MTTKEFIEKIEEMGFIYTIESGIDTNYLYVYEKYGENVLCYVDVDCCEKAFNTNYWGFAGVITKEGRDELFELLIKYSSTPINERKNEEVELKEY